MTDDPDTFLYFADFLISSGTPKINSLNVEMKFYTEEI